MLGIPTEDDVYSFLVVLGLATLRFDVPIKEANAIARETGEAQRGAAPGVDEAEIRAGVRESIRTAILDNEHLHPDKGQRVAALVVHYALTSPARVEGEAVGHRGFVVSISEKGGNEVNFRTTLLPGRAEVDEACANARRGQDYVVNVDPADAGRAARRRGRPIPRDPSLEPPPRPRPDRFMPALERTEKAFGRAGLALARECLERGACFVFRSRQIADESAEEVDASLAAMAEYDRLRLPFPRIWVETRDRIEVYARGGPRKVEVHMGIAAFEEADGAIGFYGFADDGRGAVMSAMRGEVDRQALLGGRRSVPLSRPRVPDGMAFDEGWHRAIAHAAGERLLELLFLLSAAGIDKEQVKAGDRPSGRGRGRRAARRTTGGGDGDYTIVRVPLHYDAETEGGAGASHGKGRWRRPHVRRAHMWGKHTRPPEEQRWIEATLVGAARLGDDGVLKRPAYIV